MVTNMISGLEKHSFGYDTKKFVVFIDESLFLISNTLPVPVFLHINVVLLPVKTSNISSTFYYLLSIRIYCLASFSGILPFFNLVSASLIKSDLSENVKFGANLAALILACASSKTVLLNSNSIEQYTIFSGSFNLYDLTTLQREANRHYGMTAQQTLNAAQSLYEQKLITYPRTDSQYLTEDMEVTAGNVIRRIHEKYQLTGPFDQPEKPNVKLVLNNKKVSDHHAIIPTVELTDCDLSQLKDWEQKVLFLIY